MKKILSKTFYPFLILIMVAILGFRNYVPGSWLSGWDTLHPEFNFSLYLSRILSGVWQEHQGVGAVAAQSQASELTRIPFSYLLSLIFSQNLVRYIFVFATLAVGALGIYFLAHYLLSIASEKYIKPASFLASAFYIFNLATLQQYFDPLEMFTVHFATLPWLFLLAIKYLREEKSKNLFWFALVTLFSSSMAHTATLFYVYFALFVVFVLTVSALDWKRGKFKRGLTLIFVTMILNLFWLGPNLYYIFKESGTVSNSQISKTFSSEAFLQSRASGDLKNLGLLKNFSFNWREYSFSNGSFESLMSSWDSHLKKPWVTHIGYFLTTFALLGIVVAFFRKSKYVISLLPILAISVIFLINENPPFTDTFSFLRQEIPIFGEALRFPFTKFSILLITCLAVFLAFSSQFVIGFLVKIKTGSLFVTLFVATLVYFTLPMFNGNLVDSSMRVNIPNEYFEMFRWFNAQDHSARVAKLPMQTFWGWNYYAWGYQGAGFTWFGIPQPTLDREFDRWGLYNEDFYFQASNALYSGNIEAFENVLKKYQVKYLLLDESIINAGGNSKILYIPEIKNIIAESGEIHEVKKFNFLTVYETSFDIGTNYVSTPNWYSYINSDMTYAKVDPIYATYGDYVSSGDTVFPFVNLDGRGDVKISVLDGSQATSATELVFENIKTTDELHLNISNIIKTDFSVNNGFDSVYNCDLKKFGKVYRNITVDGVLYRAEDGGVSCDYINFPDLKYSQAYVFRIAGVNKGGRSLKIYLTNYKTERADLEELLPEGNFDETYFIYPSILDGSGYTLNLETRSYGKIASENLITKIEFYPVDYSMLAAFESVDSIQNNLRVLNIQKYGTWGYKIEVGKEEREGKGLLELGQGYESGWIAFQIQGFKPKFFEHVKVNSWANGWIIPDTNQETPITLYLFYWPQVLEWGGLALGAIILTWLIIRLY